MRRTAVLLLACLVVTGCARRSVPVPSAQGRPRLTAAETPPTFAAWIPDDGSAPGRSATGWTRKLNSRDVASREQAATALAAMKDDGYPPLVEGMQSQNWEVRLACLQAMPKPMLEAKAQATAPVLRNLLRDPNPLVRQQAAARVSWLGPYARGAMPDLEALAARDESAEVRQTAADAIVDLRTSVAELTQLLRDRSALVRKRAAEDLGALQSYSRRALPTLEGLSGTDPDASVRDAAAQAVQSIRGEARQ